MGRTEHHVKNSKDFVRDVREIRIEPNKELQSYIVSALCTSVPVDKALEVIRERLEEDQILSNRTPLAPDDITWLLNLYLKCTYFLFQGEYYLQIHGVTGVTDSLQPLHEAFRTVRSSYSKTPTEVMETLYGRHLHHHEAGPCTVH